MEQFKTTEDLREYIKTLGKICARPTPEGSHPTPYIHHSQGRMIQGVREKDYFFTADKQWVLPHSQMGLSFSAHWSHLKDQLKIKNKHNKGKAINVFWILEEADIPEGLKFEADKKDPKHYLLTVTEKILVSHLAQKLSWVADRMTVIRDGSKAL